MTAAAVAQRLGLSEAAVAAFSGTGDEFAQFFGKSLTEGAWAVGELGPGTAPNQPVNVVLAITAENAWSVTWEAPPTGPAPTGYKVQITPTGGTLQTFTVGNVLTYAGTLDLGSSGDSGLVAYVRATNAVGDSAGTASAPVNIP